MSNSVFHIGSLLCPVLNFELFVSKLQPVFERLWQRPLSSLIDNMAVWYSKVPVGLKTLTMFMSDLSRKCDLDQIYINHFIRATGATMVWSISDHACNLSQISSVSYGTPEGG